MQVNTYSQTGCWTILSGTPDIPTMVTSDPPVILWALLTNTSKLDVCPQPSPRFTINLVSCIIDALDISAVPV